MRGSLARVANRAVSGSFGLLFRGPFSAAANLYIRRAFPPPLLSVLVFADLLADGHVPPPPSFSRERPSQLGKVRLGPGAVFFPLANLFFSCVGRKSGRDCLWIVGIKKALFTARAAKSTLFRRLDFFLFFSMICCHRPPFRRTGRADGRRHLIVGSNRARGGGEFPRSQPNQVASLAHPSLAWPFIDPDPRANQRAVAVQQRPWGGVGSSLLFNGEIYNFRDLKSEIP